MLKVVLRNVLEYDIKTAYEVFKPMHDNLSYSDIDSKVEYLRKPRYPDFKSFKEALDQINIFFIVNENEDKVVGYIILDVLNHGPAYINEIMVEREERKRGYGKKAIQALIEGLKEDKDIEVLRVISATMATDNFYSACNFRYIAGDVYEYRLK